MEEVKSDRHRTMRLPGETPRLLPAPATVPCVPEAMSGTWDGTPEPVTADKS